MGQITFGHFSWHRLSLGSLFFIKENICAFLFIGIMRYREIVFREIVVAAKCFTSVGGLSLRCLSHDSHSAGMLASNPAQVLGSIPSLTLVSMAWYHRLAWRLPRLKKTCTNDLDGVIPSYFTGLTGAMKKAHA